MIKDNIYTIIKTHDGELDALDIAEKLNISYHEVREITKELEKENKIEWKDDGLWVVV